MILPTFLITSPLLEIKSLIGNNSIASFCFFPLKWLNFVALDQQICLGTFQYFELRLSLSRWPPFVPSTIVPSGSDFIGFIVRIRSKCDSLHWAKNTTNYATMEMGRTRPVFLNLQVTSSKKQNPKFQVNKIFLKQNTLPPLLQGIVNLLNSNILKATKPNETTDSSPFTNGYRTFKHHFRIITKGFQVLPQ